MTQPAQQRLRPFSPVRFGRYTLVARLAQGGMGELFLAQLGESRDFQKLCVIKRMLPQLAHDPEFVERFTNEARVLVKLSHGSIAQVLELGNHEDTPFLALEYVDGKDLRRVAQRAREQRQPLPLGVSIQVMCRVLEALSYAHRKRDDDGRELQLVHRDISPPNILVSYEGEVKVIDFGLARSRLSAARTNPRSLLGKFLYMSPEQARHQPLDRRSDLYAVGLCLYELIAGAHPFEGLAPATLMARVSQPDLPHLSTVAPTCPSGLAEVVMKALAVNADQRFQSADELRIALQAHLPAADAGAESVSRAMHTLFAAEFQLERRLLAAARSPQPLQGGESRSREETAIISVPAGLQDPRGEAPRRDSAAELQRTETAVIPAMADGDSADSAPRRDTELIPAIASPAASAPTSPSGTPASGTRPPPLPPNPARAEPPPMRLAPGSGGALVPASPPSRPGAPPPPRPTPEPLPVVSARAAAATFAAPRPPPAPRTTTPPPIAPVTAAETAAASGSAADARTAAEASAAAEPTLEPEAEAALAAWFNEVPEGELETEATPIASVASEPAPPGSGRAVPPPQPEDVSAAPTPPPPRARPVATPPPTPATARDVAGVGATAPALAATPIPEAAAPTPVPPPSAPPAPAKTGTPVTSARPVARAQAASHSGDGMERPRPIATGDDAFQEAATQQSWAEDDEDEERTDPSFRLTAPEPVADAFQNRRRRTGLWMTLASLILLGIGSGAALELSQRRQLEEEAKRAAAAMREDEENAIAAAMARADAALKADAEEASAPTWQLFVDTAEDAKVLVAPLRLEVQRAAARRPESTAAVPPGELGVEWQRTSELFERLRAERTCEGALFLLCKRYERVSERVRHAKTDDATLRAQVRELRRSLEQLGS